MSYDGAEPIVRDRGQGPERSWRLPCHLPYQIDRHPPEPQAKKSAMSDTSSPNEEELRMEPRSNCSSTCAALPKRWLGTSLRELGPFSASTFADERFLSVFHRPAVPRQGAFGSDPDGTPNVSKAAGIGWRIDGWGLDELGASSARPRFQELPPGRAAGLLGAATLAGTTVSGKPCWRALPSCRAARVSSRIGRRSVPHQRANGLFKPSPVKTRSRGGLPGFDFNQLVLKALFNGVALSENRRSLERPSAPSSRAWRQNYAAERRAAGRSVPSDIESRNSVKTTNPGART